MQNESAPNCVSYEVLLTALQTRPINGKAYEERLYIVELSNTLARLNRKTKSKIEKGAEGNSDPDKSQSPNH